MEAQLKGTCDLLYKRCYLIGSKLNDTGCRRNVELNNPVRHPVYKHITLTSLCEAESIF